MIPRIRPYLKFGDLARWVLNKAPSTEEVEQSWARRCGSKYALLLPYGRSAVYFLLKGSRLFDKDILLPAYICDVMLGPIVELGNRPVLVDSRHDDFNLDDKQAEALVTSRTGALVAAAMYGQPIEASAFRKFKNKGIALIADYALGLFSFLDRDNRELLETFDIVFFSFGIGKEVTWMGGGLMLTNNPSLYERIRAVRDEECAEPGLLSTLRTLGRFLEVSIFFHPALYRLTYWLSEKTSVLNNRKGVLKDGLPADFFQMPSKLQMSIARNRLEQLDQMSRDRRSSMEFYLTELEKIRGVLLPLKSTTLSQFPILVDKRDDLLTFTAHRHIHLSRSFNKAVYMLSSSSAKEAAGNALRFADRVAVLPVYHGISRKDLGRITAVVRDWVHSAISETGPAEANPVCRN